MMSRFIYFTLLLFSLALSGAVQAKVVEAEGSAVIKGGAQGSAREMAIQQAIRQAQLQTLALVDSASMMKNNTLVVDSSKVSAAGLVKDVVVLKEWSVEGVYHVRIRAQVVEEKLRFPSNAARYRKKVAVSQFDIVDRRQIYDMYGLERELPRELLRRIENTNSVVAIYGEEYLLPERMNYFIGGEDASYQQAATHLADKLDAQFVITGVIRDLSIDYGLLNNYRQIELDVAVIDGLSGAVVSRHRVNESVRGAGEMPRGAVFGSAEFLRTHYGRAFDVVLDKLATRILEDLSILPFSAKVVKVENENIYFDAGATSLVSVGDTLMGYQLADKPIQAQFSGKFLGFQETPAATMVVKQVQPQFSMAELEANDINLKPGDVVRFGW